MELKKSNFDIQETLIKRYLESKNNELVIETLRIISHKPQNRYINPIIKLLEHNSTFNKYKGKGLTGLGNVGNSCYLNACMQIMSHTYELNDFLNSGNYKKRINKVADSVLLIEWNKLREMMWDTNCTIAPWGFVKGVQKQPYILTHIIDFA